MRRKSDSASRSSSAMCLLFSVRARPTASHHRVRPDLAAGGVAHALADLVVVLDRVLGLVLGPRPQAVLEQLRVEHHLLGLGVEVEQVAERLPGGPDGGGVARCLGVVEVGEPPAQRLVVVEDQAGHVGHGTIPYPSARRHPAYLRRAGMTDAPYASSVSSMASCWR